MSFHRISSQFTEFVVKHSKTPWTVLDQVENAIKWIASQEPRGELTIDELATFHGATDPIISDEEISKNIHVPDNRKNTILNQAYNLLKRYDFLRKTNKADSRTSKLVEKFFSTWTPFEDKAIAPIRVRNRIHQEVPEDVEIAGNLSPTRYDRDLRKIENSLMREEDYAREPLAKRRANVYALFIKAGLLEEVPNMKDRSQRMDERTFKWASLL